MVYRLIHFLQSNKASGLFDNETVCCITPVSNTLKTSDRVQSPYCIYYQLHLYDTRRGKSEMLGEKMILLYVRKVLQSISTFMGQNWLDSSSTNWSTFGICSDSM